jgi:hypothetical protein
MDKHLLFENGAAVAGQLNENGKGYSLNLFVNMKTIVKNFQDDLIGEILTSSCFGELKNNIETIVARFRNEGLPESQLAVLFSQTLQQLKVLNAGRFPYEQHANIISAKNILKKLWMQGSDARNRI